MWSISVSGKRHEKGALQKVILQQPLDINPLRVFSISAFGGRYMQSIRYTLRCERGFIAYRVCKANISNFPQGKYIEFAQRIYRQNGYGSPQMRLKCIGLVAFSFCNEPFFSNQWVRPSAATMSVSCSAMAAMAASMPRAISCSHMEGAGVGRLTVWLGTKGTCMKPPFIPG